jgi:hypothetical protein
MASIFPSDGVWLKGNLHTHTTNSDGQLSPQAAIDLYAGAGYDFLALTDHWHITPTTELDCKGLTLIPGAELHGGVGELGQPAHVVTLGLAELPTRPGECSIADFIDHIAPACELCFVAHPAWCSLETHDLVDASGHLGLEVYNCTCHRGIGRGDSMIQWDGLLARGHRLLGLAVDDTHYHYDDSLGGWLWLKAAANTVPAILSAVKSGNFHASTGPRINDIDLSGDRITISCSPCREVCLIDPRPGYGMTTDRRDRPSGLLSEVTFPAIPDSPVFRIECIDADGRRAWSNPIYR